MESSKQLPMMSPEEVSLIDAYWRAANYLSVGQIYLLDNPLLKVPLEIQHIKPRLLGHWGTTPGLNFIYAHFNRVIQKYDLHVIYIAGPGHGGPGLVANVYLEGTYSEVYPEISQDAEGLKKLFKQFSFPGGIPSHVAPETPGSIHEGGELGYAVAHAYGAVLDNPDLIACCVVGDGEAETGPLAASWHSNKFLNPARDGAVIPILHLNGYKIANPTILSRISHAELESLFIGYGYKPYFVEGDDPTQMHQTMASVLEQVISEVKNIQRKAREEGNTNRPAWPMIILRSPKGWTGPKEVDGKKTEGSWRSHQVPLSEMASVAGHVQVLEQWLKSYRPEELFTSEGALKPELQKLAPVGDQRMGANKYSNCGIKKALQLPDIEKYAIDVEAPGTEQVSATKILGDYLRDTLRENAADKNFRIFGPDETASNRLGSVFEATEKMFTGEILPTDEHISLNGRVMEVLSEHLCQGWLEGYLLTGRHGFFSCYEAFIHIIDSMFNQHAKWLKSICEIPWRRPIASLNYLLTSHVWRQDHNGFSHQDPGFIDHVANKKADIVRIYLPPDANTLLSVGAHCLKSKNYVNVIIAGKQPALQYLSIEEATRHCAKGIGIWNWATNDQGSVPDVIMACAGDVPTMETLAAVDLLRQHISGIKIRVVNVVDLMALQHPSQHPHGLPDEEFESIFTSDTPIIFAYHGYPTLIHRLTYRRKTHENFHVKGYVEEGTTTTPFDMVVLNNMDRFHLMEEAVRRMPKFKERYESVKHFVGQSMDEHKIYIREHGEDMPAIQNWRWPYQKQ